MDEHGTVATLPSTHTCMPLPLHTSTNVDGLQAVLAVVQGSLDEAPAAQRVATVVVAQSTVARKPPAQ